MRDILSIYNFNWFYVMYILCFIQFEPNHLYRNVYNENCKHILLTCRFEQSRREFSFSLSRIRYWIHLLSHFLCIATLLSEREGQNYSYLTLVQRIVYNEETISFVHTFEYKSMDEKTNSNDTVFIKLLFDSECINDTRNTMW